MDRPIYGLSAQSPFTENKWRNVIFNACVLMTEIKTIEGGQKDALRKRANIKKKVNFKLQSYNTLGNIW